MKWNSRILAAACCLLLALPLIAAAETAAPAATGPFTAQDLVLNGLAAGATTKECETFAQGLTDHKLDITEFDMDAKESWNFGDLLLTLDFEGKLSEAWVYTDYYTGPRGLKVGMTAQEVVNLFYIQPNPKSSSEFYSAGTVGSTNKPLPPCGYVTRRENGTFSFTYLAPVTPYGEDVAKNPESYANQDTAQLTVNFGTDGKVESFSWSIGWLDE